MVSGLFSVCVHSFGCQGLQYSSHVLKTVGMPGRIVVLGLSSFGSPYSLRVYPGVYISS